jgi:hypothetical protein
MGAILVDMFVYLAKRRAGDAAAIVYLLLGEGPESCEQY